MSITQSIKNLHVLIDAENISHNLLDLVLREARSHGKLVKKVAYGDWSNSGLAVWKDLLHKEAISAHQQFNFGKDSADHAMIMDAIEDAVTDKSIDGFCIVTGDGGFHLLAQRLREKGFFVLGIGTKTTPNRLRLACSEFSEICQKPIGDDPVINITERVSPDVKKLMTERKKLLSLISWAIKDAKSSFGHANVSNVGSRIKIRNPSVNYLDSGFKNLRAAITFHDKKFLIIENDCILLL